MEGHEAEEREEVDGEEGERWRVIGQSSSEKKISEYEGLIEECGDGTRRALVAATLPALVRRITSPARQGAELVKFTMVAIHLHCTPAMFVRALIDRYQEAESLEQTPRLAVRLRTISLVNLFITNYKNLLHSEELRNEVDAFVILLDSPMRQRLQQTMTRLSQTGNPRDRLPPFLQPTPKPNLIQGSLESDQLTFDKVTPLECARQLTLLHSSVYCGITLLELSAFVRLVSGKIGKPGSMANLIALVRSLEGLGDWVLDSLERCASDEERDKVAVWWLRVSGACMKLNNFAATEAIVRRLRMHNALPQQSETDEELNKLVGLFTRSNYSEYMKTEQQANPPLIPWLNSILFDLSMIATSHPARDDGLIDIVQFGRLYKVIGRQQMFQQLLYMLSKVEPIEKWIQSNVQRENNILPLKLYCIRSLLRHQNERDDARGTRCSSDGVPEDVKEMLAAQRDVVGMPCVLALLDITQ